MTRRKKRHEDHVNHEAWAIPYGDLITLLLAFFVVMYAISSVNAGKYRVLSDALVTAFHGTPSSVTPIQVGQNTPGAGSAAQSRANDPSLLQGKPRTMIAPIVLKSGAADIQISAAQAADNAAAAERAAAVSAALEAIANNVESAMHDLVEKHLVVVRHNGSMVEVEIRTDILFPSGSATLAPSATAILARLAESLQAIPNPLRVEGHTDNRPISTREFPSNWELSAARAGSVVHLFSNHGIAPSRLAVIGLGEYRPVESNDTADGRNANRRVRVVILSPDSANDSVPGTVNDPSNAPGATPASAAPNGESSPAPTAAQPAPLTPLPQPAAPATAAASGDNAAPTQAATAVALVTPVATAVPAGAAATP